ASERRRLAAARRARPAGPLPRIPGDEIPASHVAAPDIPSPRGNRNRNSPPPGRAGAPGVPPAAPLGSLADLRGRERTPLPNLIRRVPRVRSRGPRGTGEPSGPQPP